MPELVTITHRSDGSTAIDWLHGTFIVLSRDQWKALLDAIRGRRA
jgi:hypothetical protein